METEVIIQCSGRNAEERFTVDFGKIFKGDKGDAGEGVPAGGRTGQVLKKKSDSDYDTTWGDDEGITDIAPGAVGTEEIADNAVTELKLAKVVRDNINGKLNKTAVSTEPTASTVICRDNNGRAKVATPEADDDIANKQYVDARVSAVYRFCGTVATFSDLPTKGMRVGDTYNVDDTGANYSWTGEVWDKLSETVDLSGYATKTELANKLDDEPDSVKMDNIANGAITRNKLDSDLNSVGVRRTWTVDLLYAPSPSGTYKSVSTSEWKSATKLDNYAPLAAMVQQKAVAGDFIKNNTGTSYVVLQHIVGLVGGNELHRFVLIRQFASSSSANPATGISTYQLECILYDYTPATNTLMSMSLIFRDAFNDYKGAGGEQTRANFIAALRDLADNPIPTAKIADGAVTEAKLSPEIQTTLSGTPRIWSVAGNFLQASSTGTIVNVTKEEWKSITGEDDYAPLPDMVDMARSGDVMYSGTLSRYAFIEYYAKITPTDGSSAYYRAVVCMSASIGMTGVPERPFGLIYSVYDYYPDTDTLQIRKYTMRYLWDMYRARGGALGETVFTDAVRGLIDNLIPKTKLADDVQAKLTAADGAVRFDEAQELTVAQQEQVFANLGLKVVYINSSEFRTTLTEERANEIFQADMCIAYYESHLHLFNFVTKSGGITFFASLKGNANILEFNINEELLLSKIFLANYVGTGSVRYDITQFITTAQQLQARTNIAAMANTSSGDPMHYIYEAAGAEWIPYADISTDGLEDWQVKTLDTAQAQADGGVWWHNGIFVTVEQNRINYIETIGTYPLILSSYVYVLKQLTATTNYKQSGNVAAYNDITEFGRLSPNMCTMRLPNEINCNNMTRAFSACSKLRRIMGDLNVSSVSTFNGTFSGSPNLMYVNLKGLNVNLDLSGAPNLSMTSIIYAVTNAGTASFTITLAPAVYAAAMADADVQAALTSKPNVTLANAGATGGEN